MTDLERLLREARPVEPEPPTGTLDRLERGLGLGRRGVPARRWARRRGAARLVALAVLLAGSGAAIAAALVAGPSGRAAPTGTPAALAFAAPTRVGTGIDGTGVSADLAVGADGTVSVVFSRAGRVFVATRPRGGTFSAPERLSEPSFRANRPQITVDAQGTATVVWRQRTVERRLSETFLLPSGRPGGELSDLVGRRWAVIAATRSGDGAWSAPVQVSEDVGSVRDIEQPRVDADSGGRLIVVWDQGGTVLASRRPSAEAPFGPPVALGPPGGEAVDPWLSIAPSGEALAVWSERSAPVVRPDRRYQVRAALGSAATGLRPATDVGAPGLNPPYATGAVGRGERAVVSWTVAGADLSARAQVAASLHEGGDAWTAPQTALELGETFVYSPPQAVLLDGGAIDVVADSRAARRGAEGAWTRLGLPGGGRRGFVSDVAPDSAGGALAAVARVPDLIYVVGFDEAGRARDTATLRGTGGPLVLVAGRDGTSAVAWVGTGGGHDLFVAVAEPPA